MLSTMMLVNGMCIDFLKVRESEAVGPFSPYPFVLLVETLGCSIVKAMEGGFINESKA